VNKVLELAEAPQELRKLMECLVRWFVENRRLRYGSIELIVQDGKLIAYQVRMRENVGLTNGEKVL
jgi:hypothetical protein